MPRDRVLSSFDCLLFDRCLGQHLANRAEVYPNELFIVGLGEELFIYICIVVTQLYITAN